MGHSQDTREGGGGGGGGKKESRKYLICPHPPKPLAADYGGWQVSQDGAIAKATDFGEQILSQDGKIARDH